MPAPPTEPGPIVLHDTSCTCPACWEALLAIERELVLMSCSCSNCQARLREMEAKRRFRVKTDPGRIKRDDGGARPSG